MEFEFEQILEVNLKNGTTCNLYGLSYISNESKMDAGALTIALVWTLSLLAEE